MLRNCCKALLPLLASLALVEGAPIGGGKHQLVLIMMRPLNDNGEQSTNWLRLASFLGD